MDVQPFLSVVLVAPKLNGLTCWMHVQIVSGSDWLKNWRETHFLDSCSAILVSGSNQLKHWKGLTAWMHIQPLLSVVLICSNTEEGLTAWMHVQ